MSCYVGCSTPTSVANRLTGPPDAPTTVFHGSAPFVAHIGGLALTGADIVGTVVLALLLIVVGVLIVTGARRRVPDGR